MLREGVLQFQRYSTKTVGVLAQFTTGPRRFVSANYRNRPKEDGLAESKSVPNSVKPGLESGFTQVNLISIWASPVKRNYGPVLEFNNLTHFY